VALLTAALTGAARADEASHELTGEFIRNRREIP
jgi:hypothetical protein